MHGLYFQGACILLWGPYTVNSLAQFWSGRWNHSFSSRNVCVYPLLSLGPFSSKESEAPTQRPVSETVKLHRMPFIVRAILFAPPSRSWSKTPANPYVLVLYFFRLGLPLDNMSAEGFFFVASTVTELTVSRCAGSWPLLFWETNAKWPRARFWSPSIKWSSTSYMPSSHFAPLGDLAWASSAWQPSKYWYANHGHHVMTPTRRPLKDFGLFSGTQLMDFSNRAWWLPCDNTDVLGPVLLTPIFSSWRDFVPYAHPSFAHYYVLFPMNTGPFHSARNVVVFVLCLGQVTRISYLSTNDIEAIFFALD